MRIGNAGLAAVLLLSGGCGGHDSLPTSPGSIPASGVSGGMVDVSARAAGDVRTGPSALSLDRLRMDRQLPGGVSVRRQYAEPGQTYRVEAGETIELWAEYSGAGNPRLIVNWGVGEPDSPDFTGCGSCLLRHRYSRSGLYSVAVTLDDRAGTTVTRSFQLDSREPQAGTCVDNPQWQPVSAQTTQWVWSSDRVGSPTLADADANHALWTGCTHGGVPNTASLTGGGWVSTAVYTMSGCNASWYHFGGSHTGPCGGHDGDQVRRLTMDPNGCYAY